jgi:DNA polymerase (family X)
VLGVVHNHSTWSDGKHSIEEMAQAAKQRGLRYLTMTDHSPTASYANGLTEERLVQQWAEIDKLNQRLRGIQILKGTESDILPDGSLDYPDRILAQCEVVVASIHARNKMGEAEMTQRILRAMDSPHCGIIGHLTGRLIQRREPYALKTEEIFAKAAARKVAIEVNGSPDRLDIHARYVRQAIRMGVKIVVSADAHSQAELEQLSHAVATARKGWARKSDVLNTADAPQFLGSLYRGQAR